MPKGQKPAPNWDKLLAQKTFQDQKRNWERRPEKPVVNVIDEAAITAVGIAFAAIGTPYAKTRLPFQAVSSAKKLASRIDELSDSRVMARAADSYLRVVGVDAVKNTQEQRKKRKE